MLDRFFRLSENGTTVRTELLAGLTLILVALNNKGLEDLLKDKFKIGADASAAAGPVGRNAQASTDLQMKAELLTWSRSRGVFAGIDLSGVSVSKNDADTEQFYGKEHTYEQILKGAVPSPEAAHPFLSTVGQYFGKESPARSSNEPSK